MLRAGEAVRERNTQRGFWSDARIREGLSFSEAVRRGCGTQGSVSFKGAGTEKNSMSCWGEFANLTEGLFGRPFSAVLSKVNSVMNGLKDIKSIPEKRQAILAFIIEMSYGNF